MPVARKEAHTFTEYIDVYTMCMGQTANITLQEVMKIMMRRRRTRGSTASIYRWRTHARTYAQTRPETHAPQ